MTIEITLPITCNKLKSIAVFFLVIGLVTFPNLLIYGLIIQDIGYFSLGLFATIIVYFFSLLTGFFEDRISIKCKCETKERRCKMIIVINSQWGDGLADMLVSSTISNTLLGTELITLHLIRSVSEDKI